MKRSTLLGVCASLIPLLIGDLSLAAPAKRSRVRVPPPMLAPPVKPNTFEGAEPGDDKIKIKISEDGKTIFVAGEMVFGTYRKFARVLKTAPAVRTVHLGSPGGIVLEGFLMSALVRERKLNTYVETFCSSSCTQVLVAGADRAAAPLAKVGFHASAAVEDDGKLVPVPTTPLSSSGDKNPGPAADAKPSAAPDENDDLIFKSSFVRSGVAQDFITRAFTTPHTDMWYPSIAEMVTARILTRTSAGDEIKVAPGIGMARSTLEADLLKQDMWQQAKLLRTTAFEAAITEALRISQIGTPAADVVETAEGELVDSLMDELTTAPPAILDGFAVLSLDLMNADPLSYFSSCGRAAGIQPDREPVPTPELDAREDRLLVALMQNKDKAKPLSFAKSGKLITRLLLKDSSTGLDSSDAQTCKDAKALITAIAALPQKKRAEAYRALLVYGGDEEND